MICMISVFCPWKIQIFSILSIVFDDCATVGFPNTGNPVVIEYV